jgi:hypothetical protein
MSKKLLSEAQVRRFQALATISPINEVAYNEEETMEGTYASNEEMVNEEEEEMDMAPEAPEMDADEDMNAEADADVEMDEDLVEKFMDAVSTIQQVADALAGEAGDMDMDAEAPMDMDADEEAPLELDAGDEEEPEEDEEAMLQEALSGVSYVPSQKEIVKTVAKRVAKRLQEAKNAQAKLNKALGKK